MTDDINAYKNFDFTTEASTLMKTLGPLTANAMLVGVDATPSGINMTAPVGNEDLVKANANFARKLVTDHYTRYPGDSSYDFPASDENHKIIGHVLAIKKYERSDDMLGKDNTELMRLWIMYHEVGHIVLQKGPNVDDNHPYKEAAADAFAALCFLQRFGDAAVPFISQVSWTRAYQPVMNGQMNHLTTPTLDAIAADAPHLNLANMPPADMVKLAGSYARHWTPTISSLSQARNFFAQSRNMNFTDLAKTSLTSSSALTTYLGGVFIKGFENGVVLDGNTRQFSPEVWQGLNSSFSKRADELNLSAVFREKSARLMRQQAPTAKLMDAPRTTNGKPLTANF